MIDKRSVNNQIKRLVLAFDELDDGDVRVENLVARSENICFLVKTMHHYNNTMDDVLVVSL